ncbi:MAG: malonate decarboxylase subunit alpha [Synergistaceae bacterium]|nr:malonate decarboxylase subunit alpha [Clostridiaceae bacterium]NLX75663.1 malonate decarboxylase subunit alpha [Synergistaceae bacterium]
MNWHSKRDMKRARLESASPYINHKLIETESIAEALEALMRPGDRVVIEGDNQKQATFLAKALTKLNPDKVHDVTMIVPSISRAEHLDVFDKGIASEINFAYAGVQSVRLADMLAENKLKIGAIHTYLELYSRLFVDLIPDICLVAADQADPDGNLFTGYSTEDTPTLVESAAFHQAIVVVQANEIVERGALPRIDIPGDWVDLVVLADEPYQLEALFTRDPKKIRDQHILMGMMTIKGIYEKHGVTSLNHGIGYNSAAIELLLPTYGEELGLKGKVCKNWILNPHPTMIPAMERGWVESMFTFGGEIGMERYTQARSDIFPIGPDGTMRSNRAFAQIAGLYGIDLFLGATLQMDYLGNSSTVTSGRLTGFGGAPNMGHNTLGRRHTSPAWLDMMPHPGNSLQRGKKLVVQMLASQGRFGYNFKPELDAVKIGEESGFDAPPVMIYGEDVTHVVTEQGIAYLYQAESEEERRALLAAVAQETPLGEYASKAEIEKMRKDGKVALPDDLQIDPATATHDRLAAQSLDELVEWSGGLYEIPEAFRK